MCPSSALKVVRSDNRDSRPNGGAGDQTDPPLVDGLITVTCDGTVIVHRDRTMTCTTPTCPHKPGVGAWVRPSMGVCAVQHHAGCWMSHICGVSGIKSSVPDADNACVGRQSSSTIEAKRPQSAHTTDLDIPAKGEVVAIVIERVDKTCRLDLPGFREQLVFGA